MSTQPTSLRLAAALEEEIVQGKRRIGSNSDCAAAELRRLHAIEEAAKNLVKVKGRYHTEQAFNKLKELVK